MRAGGGACPKCGNNTTWVNYGDGDAEVCHNPRCDWVDDQGDMLEQYHDAVFEEGLKP